MAVGAPSHFPLEPVAGVRLGTARAGIRKPGRRALVVLEPPPGTRAAGTFTRNPFSASTPPGAKDNPAHASGGLTPPPFHTAR